MAVDYFHRLIVRGPRADVRMFRRRMYREYPRALGRQRWTEVVPFSFESLYELAPAARRVEAEVPSDPYELSAWPVRVIDTRRAEVRYQFQTRGLEMLPLIRVLARALPRLTFTLVTFYLDVGIIDSCQLSGARLRRWVISERRQQVHWDRARRKFGLAGDDVYDDDEAERWAEEEMLHEAIAHWDTSRGTRGARPRRYRWWNAPALRDLATERTIASYEAMESLSGERTKTTRKAKRAVSAKAHEELP